MTKPLSPAVKAARAEARLRTHLELSTTEDLDAGFELLAPGETLLYWRGESLARECQDWQKDGPLLPKESRVAKLRRVRDWAAGLQASKLGLLTQKKDGDTFDYRITKQKGPTRWHDRSSCIN